MEKLFSDFGINWTSIIFYIINFLVLVFLLNLFLYKPVLKILDERKRLSKELLDNVEKSRADLEKLESKIDETLKDANTRSQKILDEAKSSANEIVQETSDKAQEKADKILETARKEIEEDRKTVANEIRTQTAKQVKDLFTVVVGKLPSEDQQRLIKESLDKSA